VRGQRQVLGPPAGQDRQRAVPRGPHAAQHRSVHQLCPRRQPVAEPNHRGRPDRGHLRHHGSRPQPGCRVREHPQHRRRVAQHRHDEVRLRGDDGDGGGGDDGVEFTELAGDELLVALPRDHPLAAGGRVDLRDLRDEAWIEAPPPGGRTMLGDACARAGFTPRASVRISEWTGKFGFVAAGLGVTLVPALAVQAVPADLVVRSLGEFAPRRTVYAALPRTALPAARVLLGFLRRQAGQAE
jgi:DNA-binding transcriptional LysR family regulator